MPDYSHETTYGAELGCRRIAGLDEVGRGPLAGPVVAVAVVLDIERLPQVLADGLNDSKALSKARREELEARMLDLSGHALWFGFGEASVAEIDTINILQ